MILVQCLSLTLTSRPGISDVAVRQTKTAIACVPRVLDSSTYQAADAVSCSAANKSPSGSSWKLPIGRSVELLRIEWTNN